jgi:hypothetical protein
VQVYVDEARPDLQTPHVEDAVATLRSDLVRDLLDAWPSERYVLLGLDAVGRVDHRTAL